MSDHIRSHYITPSHTTLISSASLEGWARLTQACFEKLDNTSQDSNQFAHGDEMLIPCRVAELTVHRCLYKDIFQEEDVLQLLQCCCCSQDSVW